MGFEWENNPKGNNLKGNLNRLIKMKYVLHKKFSREYKVDIPESRYHRR